MTRDELLDMLDFYSVTQYELGQELGVSHNTVYRWTREDRPNRISRHFAKAIPHAIMHITERRGNV